MTLFQKVLLLEIFGEVTDVLDTMQYELGYKILGLLSFRL